MEATWTDIQGVLVVGAGAAGLRAAIAAREAGREALVVTDRHSDDARTALTAGGVNAALGTRDPQDSWQQHAVDTYHASRGLSEPRAAELLAREAPSAVAELAAWGCPFARTSDGRIDQRRFGAQRYRRTCYVGDRTGRAVLDTLLGQALRLGVEIRSRVQVVRLIVSGGRCHGAIGLGLDDGRRHVLLGDATVLASGGHAGLWSRTTARPGESLGDGMALALHAGCRLADLELVQFHPLGTTATADGAGMVVTEAALGEGAHLVNADGDRFMSRYDPRRMELAPRDRVALASYNEIHEGRGTPNGGVLLDATHLGRGVVDDRLPGTAVQLREMLGIDIATDRVEVAPAAHYSMGGVLVDPVTQASDVRGLYATGETTAGLHGANRLGGNALAEAVVLGRHAGESAAQQPSSERPVGMIAQASSLVGTDVERLRGVHRSDVDAVARDVGGLLWEHCGVVRDDDGLRAGLERLPSVGRVQSRNGHGSPLDHEAVAAALRVREGVRVAEATLRSALQRRESRGAHARRDHPAEDPQALRTVVSVDQDGAFGVDRQRVPSLPPSLAAIEAATEPAEQLLE